MSLAIPNVMETLLQNASSFFSNSSLYAMPKISHYQVRFSTPPNRKPRTGREFSLNMAHTPAVEQRRVIIPNKHGEKLVGILHECGSREIVILCHGFRSSKEANALVNLAAALENARISSFRFDFAGNGESDGSFQYGYYWREAEDLHSVTQHFHESNRVVSAIVGHSKGGGVVLLYASKYHDIKTVVNLSGRYDLKAGIEERLGKDHMERIRKDGFIDVKRSGNFEYRVTLESLMDRLNTNMHEACLQIDKECRVLTVHGSSDKVVPVEDASEFAKIIPNHKLHIIEGADHSFTNHQDKLASVVVNFIKENLHQDRGTAN
ncbi:2-hydroxy-6-oxo-6-(2'-aminophenyl)hexa-2,4-dienoic acid hydrolase [Spatholobus suberectus]|nr:2-hydroxy-6-oxo-6-(2'-aminophenyl)hexa-2,4-dienoic acid hydrolase [Spatholobus suberectus]